MVRVVVMDELIRKLAIDVMRARHNTIEQACEVALQYGQHGVIVINHEGATLAYPSELVPYGKIFEFPSREAFRNWEANGHPL